VIGRLPEINRVLRAVQVLAGNTANTPLEAVMQRCREIVIEGLLPEHEKTAEFALSLGLLSSTEANVGLTEEGTSFLALNAEETYELSGDQARYLIRRHYLDGALRDLCRELLAAFAPSYGPERFTWSEIDGPELLSPPWLVEHLCQLGVLERVEHGLRTTEAFTVVVGAFREEPQGWTEERLREWLKEKKEVGDFAEELIANYEQQRLRDGGFRVESTCVRRISKLRENAGYDIESFDGVAPDVTYNRFIEVKGARSKNLHFIWSTNEIKIARELGDRYWIYFQGGIDMKNKTAKCKPLLFQNPINSILENNDITKTPHGLLVESKMQGPAK
jgi:hypothetical protein